MKRKIELEQFTNFNHYNQMMGDVIEANLMRCSGNPYNNSVAFLLALENSKASILASLELAGLIKGKTAMAQINNICSTFGKKRRAIMSKNLEIKKRLKALSPEQIKAIETTAVKKAVPENESMYR